MSATLAVLGLDAADYRLAKVWECENVLLENHTELQPVTHSLDVPATLEVWPTIATGLPPAEHGIVLDSVGWDNTAGLNVLVRLAQLLPDSAHTRIKRLKDCYSGSTYPQTDASHVFEAGSVYNWPGVTPAVEWEREGTWFERATEGELSTGELIRRYFGSTGKCIGWLAGQARANVAIAGVHVHILDHMGHMYARRPLELRRIYERLDSMIGWLRSAVDRLVIVSDHGMQTTATDDDEPGVHSNDALIATTEPGSLPSDVVGVRDWLEDHLRYEENDRSITTVDAPREHLEDLGYL